MSGGINLNQGLSMSIIYWRCVSCSLISFLLIFLDIRTGTFYYFEPLNTAWKTFESELKYILFFFFFYPRCNAGRFLYGVPDSAWWSGALGVSSCHTCT